MILVTLLEKYADLKYLHEIIIWKRPFVIQVQAEIDELEMVVLEQQDKLTIREKLSYMTSRAVQMPLGITLVLFAFQVNDFPFMEDK